MQATACRIAMNLRLLPKEGLSSITVIVMPYRNFKSVYLKIPVVALIASVLLMGVGGGCLLCLAVSGLQYRAQHRAMAEKVKFYSEQFSQWNSTLMALKKAENRFRKLFSLKSREEVLQHADSSSLASLEVPNLASDLKKTINAVAEMKDYLRVQEDIYASTPAGYPVSGNVSSNFGNREDPVNGEAAFHPGIDISCGPGSPVRATADGWVSYAGWKPGSGFVVILDHGRGFSTLYAHNEKNMAKAGGRVKRGEIISYSGSTGKSTGPHVHYEVWKDGRVINPQPFLSGNLDPAKPFERRRIAPLMSAEKH